MTSCAKGVESHKEIRYYTTQGGENMEALAAVVTDFLLRKRYITAEEKEVCKYGYAILFSNLLGFLIIILISLFAGRLVNGLIFAGIFVTTRKFSGGYHANTYFRCNLTIALVYGFYLILSAVLSKRYAGMLCIMYILYMICVIQKAPVENENKPLDDEQKIRYRRISILLGVVWGILAVIAGIYAYRYTVMVITTLFCVAGLMLAGCKEME